MKTIDGRTIGSAEEMREIILERRGELYKAAGVLKRKFVGLNAIVDSIISSIEAWYVLPEIIERPAIVCLWGMTGVGKTDLVRTLADALQLEDRFLEIQLSNKGSANSGMEYHSSLQGVLTSANIEEDKPCILLLDEMQRFRTIDENGRGIDDYRFQDLWMLLSDGKFAKSCEREEAILDLFLSDLYTQDYNENKPEEPTIPAPALPAANGVVVETDEEEGQSKEEKKPKKRKYHRSFWQAKRIKRLLRVDDPLEAIMKWDDAKKGKEIYRALESEDIHKGASYSKMLIFISGNLDEAYRMSGAAADADVDADVFHDFSKQINIVTIKDALKKRFKPEQISRFGNTHIIYPSLSKKSYERIIERHVKAICNRVQRRHKVKIKTDGTVKDFLYRNGVFPAQGVRPILSTISSCFENVIPRFLLKAIEFQVSDVSVSYEEKHLVAKVGKHTERFPIEGQIDKVKGKQPEDQKIFVAVHEAGHAIIYAILNGHAPVQLQATTTGFYHYGFMGTHSFHGSQKSEMDQIAVCLAGQAAEEFVFGLHERSTGSEGDIATATTAVANMVRLWGMDGFQSKVVTPFVEAPTANPNSYNNDIEPTNVIIENLMKQSKEKATLILHENKPFFKSVVDYLIEHKEMSPEEFQKMAKKHGIDVSIRDSSEIIYPDYVKKYKEF